MTFFLVISSNMKVISNIFGPNFLFQILAETTKSTAGLFWTVIKSLWLSYWPTILPILVFWVIYEVITRNSNMHYNSKNGFSPTFNRVVGSGVYLLLQAIVYMILHFIFGDSVYTHYWPYVLHLLVFISTGLLLNLSGFWVYFKPPRF